MATKKKSTSSGSNGSGIYDPYKKKSVGQTKSSESKKSTSTKSSGGVSSSKKTTENTTKSTSNSSKSSSSGSNGSGVYDSTNKTKVNGISDKTNNGITSKTSKSSSSSIQTKVQTNTSKSTNRGSSYDSKTGKTTSGSALQSAKEKTKEKNKSGVQKTQDKLTERASKIAQNHQNLIDSNTKVYKSGNESIDKAVQTSVDSSNKRYGNKTSTSDSEAVVQQEKNKSTASSLKSAISKQAQTIKNNATNWKETQKKVSQNHQALSDLSDVNTALSRNGQTSNPTWNQKKVTKVNLNDATQVSKLNKKSTESSETVQKNLDENPLLKGIAETNASFQKGVENSFSSSLQAGGNLAALAGRLTGNQSLQNVGGGFAQQMANATTEAEKAMQQNNSIYSTDWGQAFSSVGNMMPQTVLGAGLGMAGLSKDAIKAGTLGLMGTNVYGSSVTKAAQDYLNQKGGTQYSDLSNDEFTRANVYALLNAGKEVGTEMLDKLIPGVDKLNVNELLGEGLEEVIGGLAEPYIDQVLTANSLGDALSKGTQGLGESISSGDLLKQGLMGTASAAIMQAPATVKSVANNSKYVDANGNTKTSITKGITRTAQDMVESAKANHNARKAQADYDLNKANAKILNSDIAKENIQQTQYDVTHYDGQLSDYMTNSNDDYTKQFAQSAQADMIRSELKGSLSNRQINKFIKYVNNNGYAIEFTDSVEINGERVYAKANGENGITIDKSAMKSEKVTDLAKTVSEAIENGYALHPDVSINDEIHAQREASVKTQQEFEDNSEMNYQSDDFSQYEDYLEQQNERIPTQNVENVQNNDEIQQNTSENEPKTQEISVNRERVSNNISNLINVSSDEVYKTLESGDTSELETKLKARLSQSIRNEDGYANQIQSAIDEVENYKNNLVNEDVVKNEKTGEKRFFGNKAATILEYNKADDTYRIALNDGTEKWVKESSLREYSGETLEQAQQRVSMQERQSNAVYNVDGGTQLRNSLVDYLDGYDGVSAKDIQNALETNNFREIKKILKEDIDAQKADSYSNGNFENYGESDANQLYKDVLAYQRGYRNYIKTGESTLADSRNASKQLNEASTAYSNMFDSEYDENTPEYDTYLDSIEIGEDDNSLAKAINEAEESGKEKAKAKVRKTTKKVIKDSFKEATGETLSDEQADFASEVVEDVLKKETKEAKTRAFKGVRDAAKGKHGENAEERATAREESKTNDFRYEVGEDKILDQTAQERLDSFKKNGVFTSKSAQDITNDVKARAENVFKSVEKNGYLSNYHQYEQSYIVDAYNQVSDIATGYRVQLEQQGYNVKAKIGKNGAMEYTVTDSDGNKISNSTTEALQSSGENARELRSLIRQKASMGASMMRNVQKIWKDASIEEKVYDLQDLVNKINNDIEAKKLSKHGDGLVQIDSKLLEKFQSAENNSQAQAEVYDEIVKQLARDTPRSFLNKLGAVRNTSMLLSVPTNLRNVVGNLTMQGLGKSANFTTTWLTKALNKIGWTQTNELDLTNSKNAKLYNNSQDIASNLISEYLNGTIQATDSKSRLAKDIKNWKGGTDQVSRFFSDNKAFSTRLYQNLAYRISELAKTDSSVLADNGEITQDYIDNHQSEIKQMFEEAYAQSRKARQLQSENAWTRSDGTRAKATKGNIDVAKAFLSESGGEEGVAGSTGGYAASGDRVADQQNTDMFKKYQQAIQDETFIGRESKMLQKVFKNNELAKEILGEDLNGGYMHRTEKITNWLLNNGHFGDSAFFRMGYAREWARFVDAQGYTASYGTDSQGNNYYNFTDSNGVKLNDSQTEALLNKANQYAILEAQELVYHQYSQFAEHLNNFSKGNLGERFFKAAIMPFAKTPINIASNSVEYSPIGLIKSISEMTYGVDSGNITADQAVRHLAKGINGTGVMALGAFMYAMGMLNATGDDDEDSYEASQGKQDYSLNLPGGTYTLSWLSVANVPLFMGAQIAKAFEDGGISAEDTLNAVLNMADPIFNASYLSGLVDTLRDIGSGIDYEDSDSKGIYNILSSVFKTYITEYIPSRYKHLATISNQYKKSTYSDNYWGTILNNAKTAIPFLSIGANSLENQVDINGEDIENVGGSNALVRALYTYLSIGTYKSYDKTYGKTGSSYDNMLTTISKNSGNSDILPYVSSKLDSSTVLNAEERHDLNQYMLKNYKKQAERLLNSSLLANYDINDKDDATTVANLLSQIKSYYYYQAKKQYYDKVGDGSSVLSDTSKAVATLEKSGIPAYITIYANNRTDYDEDYSNSKQLTNREMYEKAGYYDKIMNLYEEGKISDLTDVGLSSTVAKMSEEQYVTELDDIEMGIADKKSSTSDKDRRDKTFSDLEENQAFADVLSNHNITWSQYSKYTDIESDKDEDGNTVTGSRAKKIIAAMKEDGTLESFKSAIEDGTINYDNITKFNLTSSSVKKLLGLTVQSGESGETSSSSSSSSKKSSSSSSKKSSSKSSSSSSSSSSSTTEPTFDLSDALSAINKSSSSTSSSLTQSQLQTLYNSIVSSHKSNISSLQTEVDKGK